jgi:hypothetical protein
MAENMHNAADLENRAEGQTITLYPHTGTALIEIAKVWGMILVAVLIIFWVDKTLPSQLAQATNWLSFGLVLGGVLYAAHRLLHFANTFIQITDDAIICRSGWVPSHTDTVFWVNLKDVNLASSIGESMLKTGSLILLVVIRDQSYSIRVPYLPNHEAVASYIRKRIGKYNKDIKQITYT